jgi:hypothetical protein
MQREDRSERLAAGGFGRYRGIGCVITEDYSRLTGLTFDRFRELARTPGLSSCEKVGFPNSYREGKEPAIFADVLGKLPNLMKTGQTVLDIGPGCSGLPHLLLNHCHRQQHTVLLADSPEMLQLLPDSPEIRKYPGRFPRDCGPLLSEYAARIDVILSYSVLQYAFEESSVFDFLDRALGLLAEGGEMLLGDIPNISKRKRFFSSAAGIRSHREFTGTNEAPEIIFNRPEPACIDDSVVLGLLARARAAGFDAYVVPQDPQLPMANRREDILIRRP